MHRSVDDEYHGKLEIHAEGGVVEVSGERVPTVVIRRSPDAVLNKFVPIGTRDAAHLTMSVDGVEAELRPGPGKLTRGSYRVELTVGETHYRFTPDDTDSSQLLRDGTEVASFEIDVEGTFAVHWQAGSLPADAAVGYALSVAFRTGAEGIFGVLLNGSDVVPWKF